MHAGFGEWEMGPGLVSGTLWLAPGDLMLSSGRFGHLYSFTDTFPLPHHPQTCSVHKIQKLKGRYLKCKTNKGFLKVSWTVNSSHFHALFRTRPFISTEASLVRYCNTLHGLFEKYCFPEGSESSQSWNVSSCGTTFTFLVFPLTSSEMSVNCWTFSSPVWWAQAFSSLVFVFPEFLLALDTVSAYFIRF